MSRWEIADEMYGVELHDRSTIIEIPHSRSVQGDKAQEPARETAEHNVSLVSTSK
jgi:hypothetical protein